MNRFFTTLTLLFVACTYSTLLGAPGKELKLWVNSPTDVQYYSKMIELYQQQVDKDFKLQVTHYGIAEMPDKLAIAIKTGINAPDIVHMEELFFSLYLPNRIPFLDLTERIYQSGLSSSILPQRLPAFGYKGRLYGLPQSVSGVVLYYRQDLFESLGINPSQIDTWEKFVQVGKKSLEKRISLLAMDWSYFEILLRQRGFELIDEDGNHQLDNPVVLETLEWLVALNASGVGRAPDRGHIYEPTFFSGDVANNEIMTIIGASWYGLDMLRTFTPEEIKGQWRAMPLPIWTDKNSKSRRNTSSFSGQGLLIYSGSKHPDKAWDFIRFVMENQEANTLRYTMGNCIPAYVPSWFDPSFAEPVDIFGGQNFGSLLMDLSPSIPTSVQAPKRVIIVNKLREAYWPQLMSGQITAKEAIEGLKKDFEKGFGF
jgi:ABC-type glycerol-3-phosphate transport system substrate-binding protein